MIEAMIEALIDPLHALHFLLPTGDRRSGRRSLIPNSSPFSRSTRLPFTSTASPPAPLAIRKAPSASVESIQPRPPQPCEVGRPKGRRRKNRCNLTIFLSTDATPHPAPSARKSVIRLHRKLPSAPLRAPRRFRNPKIGQQLGSTASPPAPLAIRKAPSASVESIQPRPPQPCEVGRPKGRRRKNRRQSHNF